MLPCQPSALAQDAGVAAAPAPAREILPAPPAPAREILPAPPPGSTSAPAAAPADSAPLKPEQLEALVAPLALYPDPLLSQVLVASTYPLEIIEAQQWVASNPTLKGDALLEAAKKQRWDPSVQSMVAFPDVIKRMSENIRWTTDLGNAFLAQQGDLMDAVQRLRVKAKDSGKLASTDQQTVTTKVVEKETVVVIQPAKTEVVYVPVYDPALVWGPPPVYYPYPPIYYPPPPPAGAMLVSFGVGMMVGAAMHGGWGYNCGWGHSHGGGVVVVNNHNTFVNNSNRVNHNNVNRGNSTWQHNPSHRGNASYVNSDLSKKYGGRTNANRPSQTPGVSDRRATTPGHGAQRPAGDRPSGGTMDRGAGAGNRGAGGVDRARTQPAGQGGGLDRGGGGFDRSGGGGFDRSRGGGGGLGGRGGGGGRRR
jgi:hypothetical protein